MMKEWSDIAVIAPAADIDISSVGPLREQVDGLVESGVLRVLVNCQNVRYIDSTGLAFLLSRACRLMQAGGMLSLVGTSPQVTRLLQIARLIDVLHVNSAQKPPVPVLEPGAAPVWSKTLQVCEGIENLGAYRHKVSCMLTDVALTENARFDVALAVGEALGNAYDHADGACVTLTVRAYADRVVIEVGDRGCGYSCTAGEEPSSSEERGRGIKLMRMLADAVEVERRADGEGTRVRIVKLLDAVHTAN